MSFDAFSNAYRKAVNDRISNLERENGRGNAGSFEVYKQQAGWINGLEESLQLFQETMRRFAEIEDDEDGGE